MTAPPTYFVVCFHEHCSQEAAQFITDCLSNSKKDGGAELTVHQEIMRPNGLILHVSASDDRIIELAGNVKMKKPDSDQVMREFSAKLEKFEDTGDLGPLTMADIQRCILYAMESLHFDKDQKALPGHTDKSIMRGAPILSAYREAGLIDTFPLHDDDKLDRLHKEWQRGKIFQPPIEMIRDYFGENVALYFSFTSFYTAFLIPIAIIGIFQFVLDRFLGIDFIYSNVIFSCLNLVAVTIFLEMWKRKSNEHSYKWGSGGKLRHKGARPEFRGDLKKNTITGKEEMSYPMKKTLQKLFFVSVPITFVCLAIAFILMLGSFKADHFVLSLFTDPHTGEFKGGLLATAITFLPSIAYSILVLFMNQYYLRLAHFLTEWENHRTQEQFEKFVVGKLIMFEFVNTFLSLFYVAFYLQDVAMLKSQVFSMLIVLQIVNQLQETVLPIVLRRPSTRRVINKVSKKLVKDSKSVKIKCNHCEVNNVSCLPKEDNKIALANFNLERDPYESTYDDFMEIWLQFGHVFLFSSVYPLAGFFALINNLIELRVDAYKMCKITRKPTPRSVRDIGAWYTAFSVTSIISVMTNCALLSMDKDVQAFAPNASSRDWILLFVFIEHAFLGIRIAIDKFIPDVSNEVKHAMDRDEFILKKQI